MKGGKDGGEEQQQGNGFFGEGGWGTPEGGDGQGVDPGGEALAMLRRTLGGYAVHPNFASVLMIGLGCETNQIADLLAA